MNLRHFHLAAVFFLICTLLSGCLHTERAESEVGLLLPGEDAETPAEESVTLPASFSLPYSPSQTLDPITCSDGMQQVVGCLLYEGLFQLDAQLEPQELLCEKSAYDPVSYTYTLTLRPGVTFSDGTPLTAAHAAASLERARSSARYGARLAQVVSVSAQGEALTVVLSGPNARFPALLDIPIVKSGTETALVPTGTGPYVLTDGALNANPAWWQGNGQPLQQIGLVRAGDRDAMLYQFTSHDVQLITADLTGVTPTSVTGSVGFQDANTTILQYVGFNTRRAPFDQAALRAALRLGVNRASVTSAFLSGHGSPAQFPVSPVSPQYPAQLEDAYSYDAFASAMETAGYGANARQRTVTLLVNEENSFKLSAARYLAQSLSAFALRVEVKALPWADYTAALASGNFDLYYGEVKLTADWNLNRLLATGGALNYGGWSDIQTDLLLTEYAAAGTNTAMASLCTYLKAQSPIVPICFKSTSVLVQNHVTEGLSPTMANPFYALSDVTFHLRKS